MMPRVIERLLGRQKREPELLVGSVRRLLSESKTPICRLRWSLPGACSPARFRTAKSAASRCRMLKRELVPIRLRDIDAQVGTDPLRMDAALLATSLQEPMASANRAQIVRRAKDQPRSELGSKRSMR